MPKTLLNDDEVMEEYGDYGTSDCEDFVNETTLHERQPTYEFEEDIFLSMFI